MTEIRIAIERSCISKVIVEKGVLHSLGEFWNPIWEEAAIICDTNVARLFGEGVREQIEPRVRRVSLIDFPPGEGSKNRQTKTHIEEQLLDGKFSRATCIVALGGGVSTDMGGFVAATYMRGIDYLAVPTSLLAQVDAAVGGKTGINTQHGKNLIGAFHQPSLVVVDPDALGCLPAEEWRNGLAEVVKYAIVADADMFDGIEKNARTLNRPGGADPELIARCLKIKAEIVAEDERDRGLRSILNFGHTVGHAIERALKYGIGHGIAVAMGIGREARLASRLCGFPEESVRRIEALWNALEYEEFPDVSFEDIAPFLEMDKKNDSGRVQVVLPAGIGVMAQREGRYKFPIEPEVLRELW